MNLQLRQHMHTIVEVSHVPATNEREGVSAIPRCLNCRITVTKELGVTEIPIANCRLPSNGYE
jgi:hypothetical protein